MRLPAAYRSLPRPSSPSVTKASAISPYSLAAKIGQTGRGMSKPLQNRAAALTENYARQRLVKLFFFFYY
jgi:hypothetical protein